MAGHSHWAGIKHKKEATDKKRGVVFSKLLAAITAAAKKDPNPDFNPRLRTVIEKARAESVPAANITRAIERAREAGETIETLLFEAYGPGGAALLIEIATDNKNRAVAEVKCILYNFSGKWAEPGSVRWGFQESTEGKWASQFPLSLDTREHVQLLALLAALRGHADVQEVYTNANL